MTGTDEDYAKVFQVFDRDATGGIDPFEFRAITALLGDHSTEVEARELFLEADSDNDGVLDVAEFVKLLKEISPKARSMSEARIIKDEIARERLQARIAQSSLARVEPEKADAMVTVLALGASKAGKTYLLNQVLADKLPKGYTVTVGVGSLVCRLGSHDVALQVLDTPGDQRFAPLGQIFYTTTSYALLVYDSTSFDSFAALDGLLDAFLAANAGLDAAANTCLVANVARLGVKRAVSSGYALEWCRRRGGIPFFEIEAEAPQGILEPLQHLADEAFTRQQRPPARAAPDAATDAAEAHDDWPAVDGGAVDGGAVGGGDAPWARPASFTSSPSKIWTDGTAVTSRRSSSMGLACSSAS